MTEIEGTNEAAENPADDDDYDTISLNSTEASEGNTDSLYNVERILAEAQYDDGSMWYLIAWEGYPLEVSTWEPETNIEEERTLREWSDEKMRITRGHAKPFDLNAWTAQVRGFEQAKEDRKRRRRERRKQLGFPVSPSEPEATELYQLVPKFDDDSGDEAQEVVDEPDDVPGHHTVHKPRGKQPKANSIKKPIVKPRPFVVDEEESADSETELVSRTLSVRKKRTTESEADVANLSEDSLIEDINAKAAKKDRRKAEGNGHKEKVKLKNTKKPEKKAKSPESPKPAKSSCPRPDSRDSSPSQGALSFKKSNVRPRTEAPSRTGYQGTANRQPLSRPVTQTTRGGTALRGRGGGAKRGGHQVARPSFTATVPPKQKRSLVNAILGEKKGNRLFNNMSSRRKAEMAGRGVADLAPDPGSLTLVNPAEHRAFGKIPKKSRQDLERARSNSEFVISPDKAKKTFADSDVPSFFEEPDELEEVGNQRVEKEREVIVLEEREQPLQEDIQGLQGDITQTRPQPNISSMNLGCRADSYNNSSDFSTTELFSNPRGIEINHSYDTAGKVAASSQQRPKPIAKVSYSDYKRRKMSDFSEGVALAAKFGSDTSQSASIVLSGIDKSSQELWIQELRDLKEVKFDVTCFSKDLERHSALSCKRLAIGNITTDSAGTSMLNQVAENLRPMFCVLFARQAFTVLLFPSKCEEWKFLETSLTPGGHTSLRYFIFEPILVLNGSLYETTVGSPLTSVDLTRNHLESLVGLYQGFDHRTLLTADPEHKNPSCFFLLFPLRSTRTSEFFEHWLHGCNADHRIFTAQKAGSWRTFIDQATEGGVVLIHETLVAIIFKIPWLFKLLNGKTPFTIWCVSDTSFVAPFYRPMSADGAFPAGTTLSRLFPHGGAIFLTPSFLITEPEKTFDLLNFINHKAKTSTPGAWKLIACHRLRQYLLDLAIEAAYQSKELYEGFLPDKKDKDEVAGRMGLAHKDCERKFANYTLLDSIMANERLAGYPYSWDEDVPDEFESPVIYADRNIGQNDEKRLVEWFAGWTMSRLDLFRRFIVVGTKSLKPTVIVPSEGSAGTVIKDSASATTEKSPTMVQRQIGEKIAAVTKSIKMTKTTQSSTSKKVSWSADLPHTGHPNPESLSESLRPSGRKTVSWPANLNDGVPKFGSASGPDEGPNGISSSTAELNSSDTMQILQTSSEPPLLNAFEPTPYGATSSIHLPNIGRFTTSRNLEEIFAPYGPILSTRVVKKRETSDLQGFVNFEHTNSAINARAAFQDKEIFTGVGPTRVNFAAPHGPPQDATSAIHLFDVDSSISVTRLQEVFGIYGPLFSTRIVSKKPHGLQGFVNFEHENSAANAMAALKDKEILPGVAPTRLSFTTPRKKDGPEPEKRSIVIPSTQQSSRPLLLFPNQPRPLDASSSLYLGEIPESYQDQELREIFEQYGPILSTRSIPLKGTSSRRRNGFINFMYTNSAINARTVLSKKEIFPGEGLSKIGFAKTLGYKSPPGSPRINDNFGNEFASPRALAITGDQLPSVGQPSNSIQHLSWRDDADVSVREPREKVLPKLLKPQRDRVNKTQADSYSGRSGDNYMKMDISEDEGSSENHQLLRSSHGIDRNANEKVLIFVGLSGYDLPTAERYLEEHHGNIEEAYHHYLGPAQASDLEAVSEEGSRFIDRLAHEDVQRAMQLLHPEPYSDHESGPSNMGGSDERGGRLSSRLQSASSLVSGGNTSRKILPSPIRLGSASIRPEIDMENRSGNCTLDESSTDDSRGARKKNDASKFEEATLDWYEKAKRDGRSWEHILVTDGDKVMKALAIKPRKV